MNGKSGMEKAVDAAITAKKLAAIARAAAVAGIKGAAIQAAKEFSPQLVKIIIVILIILILLPFLIVAALPNIFFQYGNSSSADVNAMTDMTKPSLPTLPYINLSGTVSVIENNWLCIKLNTLLPHCRFQAPKYLSDTIMRLLDNYADSGGTVPYYEKAMLIIDEHCDISNRSVYDQDNKSWKAVSNALKGRLFPDDD